MLHVGCGTSMLGVAMTREGYEVVNSDASPTAIEFMRQYPGKWEVGDATSLEYSRRTFDIVLDKGTLDALACNQDKTLGIKMVDECTRVGRAFVCVSFGQPETRLKYFRQRPKVHKLRVKSGFVYVYVCQPRSRVWLLACVPLLFWSRTSVSTAQCNYDVLQEFASLAHGLQWTLGAGTLLGALRTDPPGLLPWELDVDVYVTAQDAFRLLERLLGENTKLIEYRGFVDIKGRPCCGFGFKLFHKHTDACQLDVLVLATANYAPWVHGETRFWPPWGIPVAHVYDRLYSTGDFLVIPEDVDKRLLGDKKKWRDGTWLGPSISYFHKEYFRKDEFEPVRTMMLYDFEVNIPNDPWASLNRTYGPECSYMARIDTRGGREFDLRDPRHAHLKRPAVIHARAT